MLGKVSNVKFSSLDLHGSCTPGKFSSAQALWKMPCVSMQHRFRLQFQIIIKFFPIWRLGRYIKLCRTWAIYHCINPWTIECLASNPKPTHSLGAGNACWSYWLPEKRTGKHPRYFLEVTLFLLRITGQRGQHFELPVIFIGKYNNNKKQHLLSTNYVPSTVLNICFNWFNPQNYSIM